MPRKSNTAAKKADPQTQAREALEGLAHHLESAAACVRAYIAARLGGDQAAVEVEATVSKRKGSAANPSKAPAPKRKSGRSKKPAASSPPSRAPASDERPVARSLFD